MTESTQAIAVKQRKKFRVPWWISRLAQGFVILFFISVLVFTVTQALPGDVVNMILGQNATPERVALVKAELGLDRSLWDQYWSWFSGLLRGDFGSSLATGREVSDVIGLRLRNTLVLSAITILATIPLAILIGVLAAVKRDRATDKTFLGFSMVVNATPEFVLGTLFIAAFSTTLLHWLPAVSIFPPEAFPTWYPLALVLPVATLTTYGVMYLARLVRASFIDSMQSEYVEAARLKGLTERRILFRHVMPNALAPVIPAASIVAAITIGGTVVIEYLFAYPGIGTILLEAISNRDLPIIQALVMIIASAYFILNFVADLLQKDDWSTGR